MLSASALSFITIIVVISAVIQADDDLVAVTVLYRHGDRTIAQSYPRDKYSNASLWPVPYGELTNEGKNRHYALGKWLRDRYSNFLSHQYLASEINIQSSNYDRCLMSAASNLAGLYPPYGNQVWNSDLQWQPIPIHTKPNAMDGLLALEKPCPRYHQLSAQLLKDECYVELANKTKDLYEYLSEKTGQKIDSIFKANDLYDTLLIENLFNFTLPEWTKSVFPQKLQPLAMIAFEFETHTVEMAKIRAGQILDKVLKQFDFHLGGAGSRIPKFQVFSAHDTNVFNVLNSLRVPITELVPYSGMLMFELKKSKDGHFYVQLYYKKSGDPDLVEIKGCTKDCDIHKFVEILKPLALNEEEWNKECELKEARR